MYVDCAIVFDEDKSFITFSSLEKGKFKFIQEIELPLPLMEQNVLDFLYQNIETFDKKIKEIENKKSFIIKKIFLGLPWNFVESKVVSETFLLKRKKKITTGDISLAKSYLENKFLDWDDFCVHNIPIHFNVEGIEYDNPPLNCWAKKIEIKSLLMWIKDKVYKEVESIFDSLDRVFGGVIAGPIGLFAQVYEKKNGIQAVISIDYGTSHIVIRDKSGFNFIEYTDFGVKKILDKLANEFLISLSLAEEVFLRYISFKELSYSKEITVKKEDSYINLSTQSINMFTKRYIGKEIERLIKEIKQLTGNKEFAIAFVGRLNSKEGFYGFLTKFVSVSIKSQTYKSTLSPSFGCVKYGTTRFLENEHKVKNSFFYKISAIYNEYF
ncbi:MAG: hypothetical protein KAS51_00875 [Candidatus Omnitrophica bacterium]|nr:hypothetical protein [Candidatus Omnitrophota bacterium]